MTDELTVKRSFSLDAETGMERTLSPTELPFHTCETCSHCCSDLAKTEAGMPAGVLDTCDLPLDALPVWAKSIHNRQITKDTPGCMFHSAFYEPYMSSSTISPEYNAVLTCTNAFVDSVKSIVQSQMLVATKRLFSEMPSDENGLYDEKSAADASMNTAINSVITEIVNTMKVYIDNGLFEINNAIRSEVSTFVDKREATFKERVAEQSVQAVKNWFAKISKDDLLEILQTNEKDGTSL